MSLSTVSVVRGLNNSGLPEMLPKKMRGRVGWSNVDFRDASPTGTDAISLILQILMSTGNGTNFPGAPATNYDVLPGSVGLAIPHDQVDVTSFENIKSSTAVKNHYDWDINQELMLVLTEREQSKRVLDEDLCRPFGLYLHTGNDGIIRCVRPRHPQKIYVGDANRRLKLRYPAGSGAPSDTKTITLPIGVYTCSELAGVATTKIGEQVSGFTVSYNSTTAKFTISKADNFDLVASTDLGWKQLGWTAEHLNTSSSTAQEERGRFSGFALTEADMTAVEVIDNQEDRITRVHYHYDYDPIEEEFMSGWGYDGSSYTPEIRTVQDTFGFRLYSIASRGLVSGGDTSGSWAASFGPPSSGCEPTRRVPALPIGVNAETWSVLFALTLIDRYREPPLKFRARLKWRWNHLEVGDVVKVDYSIPGVLYDTERRKDTIEDRLFEVVELHPNFDGTLDATFLGHRYVANGAF